MDDGAAPMNTSTVSPLSARASSLTTGFSIGGENHPPSVVPREATHRDSRDGGRQFVLQHRTRTDHEGQAIAGYCALNGLRFRVVRHGRDVAENEIPVGDVAFIHEVLGRYITPDYYPRFLDQYLHRKIWWSDSWPYHQRCFVKPADRHKRFTGFVKRVGWKGRKKGPLWCSEIVEFVSEWRWYIHDGKIIDARWGSGIEAPVPELGITFPKGYCAAVDFGRLATGELALIEANSPFSCGWYGPLKDAAIYARWLSDCWIDSLHHLRVGPWPARAPYTPPTLLPRQSSTEARG